MDTENLIQSATMNKVWDTLKEAAKLSFIQENKIYKLAGLEFKDAQALAESLTNSDSFVKFQIALQNLIYGNKSFIKYFYDTDFINKIAAETKASKQIAETFNEAMGKGKAGAIKSENIQFKSIGELNSGLKQFAENIMSAFSDSDIIDQDYLKKNEEAITEALIEALHSTPFQFGFGKGGKKNTLVIEKEYREKMGLYADDLPPLSSIKSQVKKSRGESKVYLMIEYKDFKNFLEKHPNEGIEFQLYGDKDVFQSIFDRGKLANMAKNLLKAEIETTIEKDGITLRTTNLFMDEAKDKSIFNRYKINKDNRNTWATPATFEEDIKEISILFFNVIEKELKWIAVNDQKAIKDFEEWKEQGIQSLITLLRDNPASIYEIGTKSTRAHTSGMLGETLFSLLLTESNLKDGDLIYQKKVQILGQTSKGGTGEAAVDTKLVSEKLGTIGFQIKNYSTSKNIAVLYNTSNSLYDEKSMSRYIKSNAYKALMEIFERIYWNKNWEENIEKAENIFNEHLPYYIRYDEAAIESSTEQSNFYIINFNFIPASVIFIYMIQALGIQLEEFEISSSTKNTENFFYFSPLEVKKEKLDAMTKAGYGEVMPLVQDGIIKNSFKDSWLQTFNTIKKETDNGGYYTAKTINSFQSDDKKPRTKTDNLLSALHDDVRINFTGVKLNFSDKVELLLQQAKKKA